MDILSGLHLYTKVQQGLMRMVRLLDEGYSCEGLSVRRAYSLYLVASVLYYHYNINLMKDSSFDKLCHYLLDNVSYTGILMNKQYFLEDSFKAGTGFNVKEADLDNTLQSVIWLFHRDNKDTDTIDASHYLPIGGTVV